MAETLGSLIDKLTIKELREFHVKDFLKNKKSGKGSPQELRRKLGILRTQKRYLIREVEDFIGKAVKDRTIITDEKLKLYNKPDLKGGMRRLKNISSGIDKLAKKNIELWHLEDQARGTDVDNSYIGRIKKRIDKANQQRNDLIDGIDQLFKKYIKKHNSR